MSNRESTELAPHRRQADPEGAIPSTADVRAFWELNPVAAASVEARLGSAEFFAGFDRLREEIEPRKVQNELYSFDRFRSKAVLEVGCGNGYVLSQYARAGAAACGVDLTRTAMDLTQRRFVLEGLTGVFVQADAERLPFGSGSFDLVISVGVLHHVPCIEAAIGEIHRVLSAGGRILLMLYHRNSLHYRLLYPLYGLLHPTFRGLRPAEIARRIDGAGNPIGRTYSRGQVRELLAAFRDVRVCARSLPIRPLLRLPGGGALLDLLARWAGWFLYARAVK